MCQNINRILPDSDAVKPIRTQYNQKSLNNLRSRGLGCLMGGRRLNNTANTGINIPKLPALLDA